MSSEPKAHNSAPIINDAAPDHWVYRAPVRARPYLQLSRLDRPVGYWLLALPGWIGLSFASLSHGFAQSDLKWALLILIGAIAMRGAGCTYNDIVDQDLDKQVERTALRPLPAGTISTKQAWLWLLAQCAAGLIVLLQLPRLAQIIALGSLPLVAAYPFMKRITWWPQIWLGLTFNWAVLVAYAAKTEGLSSPLFILYIGLVFWTVGYDTIYACQDIEDDAMIGVKSTARRFGHRVKFGVGSCYAALILCVLCAVKREGWLITAPKYLEKYRELDNFTALSPVWAMVLMALPVMHLIWQLKKFTPHDASAALSIFKSNLGFGLLLCCCLILPAIGTEFAASVLHTPQ